MSPDKTRRRAGWLRGALGLALPVGLFLLFGAFVAWIILDPEDAWTSAPVAAPGGAGALLAAIGALYGVRRLASALFRRRAAVGLNVAAMVALATGLAVLVNLVSAQRSVSWHWTEQDLFALSSNTLNVLKEVDAGKQDLRITVAFGAYPFTERVMTLLNEYARHSARVKVERIDFYRDAGRVEMLKRDLKNPIQSESLVFLYGDRERIVDAQELIEVASGGFFSQTPSQPRFRGEAVVTSAIKGLVERGNAKVCFTQGHGEFAVDDHNIRGLSELDKRLRRDNYETQAVNLAEQGVPEDCAVLAIVAPSMSFSEKALDAVREFALERGGNLLVLPRPQAALGRTTGLREFLYDEFGVNIRDDLLVATRRGISSSSGDPQITVSRWGDHPIARDLANLTALFTWSCPVEKVERPNTGEAPQRPARRLSPLATSAAHTWGETSVDIETVRDIRQDSFERAGPFTLGLAVEPDTQSGAPASGARVVVIGNAVSATNQVMADEKMAARYVNRALVLGAVNWLAERDYDVGVEPLRVKERPLDIDSQGRRAIRAISWFALPLGLVAVASLVLWRRTRG